MYRVGLIGAGNMGRAMMSAWLGSGVLAPDEITVTDKEPSKSESAAAEFGVALGTGVAEVASSSQIVVLAVKPQDSALVLDEVAGKLPEDGVFLSIAAGLTIGSMRKRLGEGPTIVRVMPNMAAQVNAAVSAFAVDAGTGKFDKEVVRELLGAIGEVEEVDEKLMDLVTAVSGSGPAYFFYLTEVMEKAAIEQGLPPEIARKLARETLWGAAKTIKEKGTDPGDLRKAVSSPGGTTLAALSEMDSSGFADMMKRAIDAATRRAGELAQ